MNIEAVATRIYSPSSTSKIGGLRESDFAPDLIKPGTVILRSVKPPKTMGGIIIDPAVDAIPGTACVIFRVVCVAAVPPPRDVAYLRVQAGDVVIPRTSQLEPLQPDLMLHSIKAEHLLLKLPDESAEHDDTALEAALFLVRPVDVDAKPQPGDARIIQLPTMTPPLPVRAPSSDESGAAA